MLSISGFPPHLESEPLDLTPHEGLPSSPIRTILQPSLDSSSIYPEQTLLPLLLPFCTLHCRTVLSHTTHLRIPA